jgi:poly-gamma-glutamate capsule biosynthesis protein CapA/YwtB (metallophosphatase superfamily)
MTAAIKLFLCGDVMTGRGIDQVLPHPCEPTLHEGYLHSALDYVRLAEQVGGPITRPVGFAGLWGDALQVWRRAAPRLTYASPTLRPASPAARTGSIRASTTG